MKLHERMHTGIHADYTQDSASALSIVGEIATISHSSIPSDIIPWENPVMPGASQMRM